MGRTYHLVQDELQFPFGHPFRATIERARSTTVTVDFRLDVISASEDGFNLLLLCVNPVVFV
jgi:hypothetical protein